MIQVKKDAVGMSLAASMPALAASAEAASWAATVSALRSFVTGSATVNIRATKVRRPAVDVSAHPPVNPLPVNPSLAVGKYV